MFQLKKSGTQELKIRATDYVGNQRVSIFNVIVDDMPPTTKVIAENEKGQIISTGKGVQRKAKDVPVSSKNKKNNKSAGQQEEGANDFTNSGIEIGPRIEE